MKDAVIFAPWQSFERRYLAAAQSARMNITAVASAQALTSRLYRDPDTIGVIWLRGQASAEFYVRQARLAGVRNIIVAMLHQEGDADELARARAAVLMAGADDCQPSMIEVEELTARLKAVTQRGTYVDHLHVELPGAIYHHDRLRIETRDGQVIRLSPYEGAFLQEIARRAGRTISRASMMDAIYGHDEEPAAKALDVYVSKVRRKVMSATGGLDVIRTVRGQGWSFDAAGYQPDRSWWRGRAAQ